MKGSALECRFRSFQHGAVKTLLAWIFGTGALVIGCGIAAVNLLGGNPGFALLRDALTLGGGLFICGFFALRSRWHGIIGAGVLVLLGAGRGLMNVPGAFRYFSGDSSRGAAPVLELIVTVACLVLLAGVVRVLSRERARRFEEQRKKEWEREIP